MAAVGSALIDKQIRDQWEHFESLLKDRSIRVDELGDEPCEGFMVHEEGFTAFIGVNFPELLTGTEGRLRLSKYKVAREHRPKLYRHVDATSPIGKLEAIKQFVEEVDGYIVARKEKSLGKIGKNYVWYVCPVCPNVSFPMLDMRSLPQRCRICNAVCRKGLTSIKNKPAKHKPSAFAIRSCKKKESSAAHKEKQTESKTVSVQEGVPFILHPENKSELKTDKDAPSDVADDGWRSDKPVIRKGISASLQLKKQALHFYENFKQHVGSEVGGKVAYSESFKADVDKAATAKRTKSGSKRNRQDIDSGSERRSHLAREVAAELLGIHPNTLRDWSASYGRGELAEPQKRGVRKTDARKYAEHYEELLEWAEKYEARMKIEGTAFTWQDIAAKALEDPQFKALEEERQAIRSTAGEVLTRIAELTVEGADDTTSPIALLNAMGIGPEPVEDPLLKRTTWRLKHILSKLGFSCEKILRESLKSIVGKVSWTTKFCIKYFDFLTEPADHMGEYLVWLDESFFYAGEGEKQSLATKKDAHFAEKGDYKRFGLLDALLMYWQPLPRAQTENERDYFRRAEADPSNWFIKDGHYLCCRKVNDTILVWLAQKQKEKQEAVPKAAEQAGPDGDRLGTMNYHNFTNWWFIGRLLLFKQVLQSDSRHELEAYLKAGRDELQAEELEDLNTLKHLLHRQACFVMDGAMYHKGTNPYYVQRDGDGGLFGAGGNGRHNKANGWKKDRCIYWLFLHKFGKKNAKDAFKWLEDRKDLVAHADDYEFAKWLYEQDELYLRDMVDKSEFASNIKFELCALAAEYGLIVYWTPPHVGKYLNPIEILWSIVKTRARRLSPEQRKGDSILKRELRGQLSKVGKEHGILLNICLPSMRFCLAILKAVFEGKRLVHKRSLAATETPILFTELHEACKEFGLRIGHEEVDENSAKDHLPDDIELEIPLGLIDAAIPRKVTKVRTWDELGSAATAESEQQSTRSRLSAITLLSMQEMPAEVQEALNSDSEVEFMGCRGEEADALDPFALVAMECEAMTWNYEAVKSVTWNENYGWWIVVTVDAGGVEKTETVEPESWFGHDVPPGSQHLGPNADEPTPKKHNTRLQSETPPPKAPPIPVEKLSGAEPKPNEDEPKPKKQKTRLQSERPPPKAPPIGYDKTQQRAAEAKLATKHRGRATRSSEHDLLARVRSTMEKLTASRFRCTCGTKTAVHGGDDKKCGVFDRGGFQRRLGEDMGVTQAEFDEAKAFYPKRKFV